MKSYLGLLACGVAMAAITAPASAQTGGAQTPSDAAGAQTPALPQTSGQARPEPGDPAGTLPDQVNDPETEAAQGDVVVQGIRAAYADAVETKREAVGITDGISLENIGRFPDLNLGEALQRIPGVQINREADRRDATIALRGLPGEFARQTLNGQTFAAAFLDASSPLGIFESEVFSAVQIIKSPSAADQPGGLSGNIDYRLTRALARKDGAFSLRVGGAYEELSDAFVPTGALSVSKHLLDGRLGFYAVGAYSKQLFRRDSISINRYVLARTQQTPDLATRFPTAQFPNGVFVPGQVRQFVRINEGDRYSAALGTEFEANDNLSFAVNGLYTRRALDKGRLPLLVVELGNNNTPIVPTGTPFTAPNGRTYVTSVDFRNGEFENTDRNDPVINENYAIIGDATYKNDDWRVVGTGAYTQANSSFIEEQFNIIEAPGTLPATNGTFGSLTSAGTNLDGFELDINPTPVYSNFNGPWRINGANELVRSPVGAPLSTTRFRGFGSQNFVDNTVKTGQIDIERFIHGSLFSGVQVGVRYENNLFENRDQRLTLLGVNTANVGPSFIGDNPAPGFFRGQIPGATTNWVSTRVDFISDALRPITVGPGQSLTVNGYVNDVANGNVRTRNFTVENDIMSAYGMVKLNGDVFGMTLRGALGVRYETTTGEINAVQANPVVTFDVNRVPTFTRRFTPFRLKQDYDDFLPSALLALDITRKLVLRGAYYETFVRPYPRTLTPVNQIDQSGGFFNVTLGNAQLRPYKAESFDASLEWYNRPGGLISVAAYQKRVLGLITPVLSDDLRCPSDPNFLGLGNLSIVNNQCRSDIELSPGNPDTRLVIGALGNTNSESPITVRGIEAQIQQTLFFLPAPFNNLGGVVNYSYTDLKGRITQRGGTAAAPTFTTIPAVLNNVSTHVVNLVGYYESKLFGVRLAYNYRSSYTLPDGGTFGGTSRSVRARGQLDASASVRVTPNITLAAEAFNLTDANRFEYESDERVLRRVDSDGRVFQGSVRFAF